VPAIGSVWAPGTWDVDAWGADTWGTALAPPAPLDLLISDTSLIVDAGATSITVDVGATSLLPDGMTSLFPD
jgi:hypothetical protein